MVKNPIPGSCLRVKYLVVHIKTNIVYGDKLLYYINNKVFFETVLVKILVYLLPLSIKFTPINIAVFIAYWLHPENQETFLRKMNDTVKISARHRLMAAPVDAPR